LFCLLRLNPKIALSVTTLSLILSHRFFSSAFVGDHFSNIISWLGLDYRDIYCLHIYLFFLGMCFVPFKWIFTSREKEQTRSRTLKPEIIVFFGLVLISFLVMLAYKIFNIKFLGDSWLLALLALIGLTIYTTEKNIYFQYLVFLGKISYAIYLFHKSFFYSFDLVPITANSVWLKLLAVAIFFPIFLICCIKLEKLGVYCSKILKKYNPFVRSQITV
jgi:peptidoglycan/LPS O-acetylase OafA/YrhL